MAELKTKDIFFSAGPSGSEIQLSGPGSGLDVPAITQEIEVVNIPSQSDWEHNTAAGQIGYPVDFTVHLRDNVGPTGVTAWATTGILRTWIGKAMKWTLGRDARDATSAAGAPTTGKTRERGEFIVGNVTPSADGGIWRVQVTGRGNGPITYDTFP